MDKIKYVPLNEAVTMIKAKSATLSIYANQETAIMNANEGDIILCCTDVDLEQFIQGVYLEGCKFGATQVHKTFGHIHNIVRSKIK